VDGCALLVKIRTRSPRLEPCPQPLHTQKADSPVQHAVAVGTHQCEVFQAGEPAGLVFRQGEAVVAFDVALE
jgi:hypothetical protein